MQGLKSQLASGAVVRPVVHAVWVHALRDEELQPSDLMLTRPYPIGLWISRSRLRQKTRHHETDALRLSFQAGGTVLTWWTDPDHNAGTIGEQWQHCGERADEYLARSTFLTQNDAYRLKRVLACNTEVMPEPPTPDGQPRRTQPHTRPDCQLARVVERIITSPS